MDDRERDIWRAVFDIAVGSMDFGSGFLDDAEVAALRAAAVILGVDPEVATPANFICKYRGVHTPVSPGPGFDGLWDGQHFCRYCSTRVRWDVGQPPPAAEQPQPD